MNPVIGVTLFLACISREGRIVPGHMNNTRVRGWIQETSDRTKKIMKQHSASSRAVPFAIREVAKRNSVSVLLYVDEWLRTDPSRANLAFRLNFGSI